ncbi:hypothetical protein [Acinetobacter sp. WCHAc010052]|uniref:hypothetical protein n=1 Tax=Acinetobacter sp. WCHAc010052 TaxID=2004647 RepID=UPI001D18A640|nr:hypothetical protein [Acinetobacter sp. WCHAc010052]
MMKIRPMILSASFVLCSPLLYAESIRIPTVSEAKQATVDLLGKEIGAMISELKLGTCISAVKPTHPGQIACTLTIRLGAAINETQSDFYQKKGKWVAMPSESQDKLPFPDPELQ